MLKCKVNTQQFQEALKKLEVIRPNKHKVKILENIKVEVTREGVKLITTDLENHVTITVDDVQIESYGDAVITSIKELMKSLKFMTESYTELTVNSDNIIISNGNRNIKVKTEPVEEYVKEFEIGNIENTYTYNSKSLYNRIKKVDCARANDETRPILTGIHFRNSDIVAVDGYKLALNTDQNLVIEKPFTIATGTIKFLNKTLNNKKEELTKISTNEKFIIFEYENIKIISRLLEGQFLDYKNVFPQEYKEKIEIETKKLKDDIEFLNTYAKEHKNELVMMILKNKQLELKVNNEKGIFNTTKEINSNYELTTGFNSKYLLDILKTIENKKIKICLNHSINPITIEESDNEKYLLMVVRLSPDMAA